MEKKKPNQMKYIKFYRNSIRKVSGQFLDRPLSPIDTATYWIEYVIKYGKDSLRSPAMDLTWWQIQLLDVYAIIAIGAIVAGYVISVLARVFFNLVLSKVKVEKQKLT